MEGSRGLAEQQSLYSETKVAAVRRNLPPDPRHNVIVLLAEREGTCV